MELVLPNLSLVEFIAETWTLRRNDESVFPLNRIDQQLRMKSREPSDFFLDRTKFPASTIVHLPAPTHQGADRKSCRDQRVILLH